MSLNTMKCVLCFVLLLATATQLEGIGLRKETYDRPSNETHSHPPHSESHNVSNKTFETRNLLAARRQLGWSENVPSNWACPAGNVCCDASKDNATPCDTYCNLGPDGYSHTGFDLAANGFGMVMCQPGEKKGSYSSRHATMDFKTICEKIEGGQSGCFTLDDFKCTDKTKCLKWGSDAYAGRVLLPRGVRLDAYGDWSCSSGANGILIENQGDNAAVTANSKSASGQSNTALFQIWDWNWRVDAFKLSLLPGYTCSEDNGIILE